MYTDVLIVGAGPTGLMLANQLARRGMHPMIIDRHSGPAQQTRAMAVHARTMEIYAKLGVIERALELGRRGVAANLWTGGRRKARIPLGDIGENLSPYPFVLMLGQDDNEQILGESLRQQGIAVQWNTELVALEQHPDKVTTTLRQPDGSTLQVSAAFVAGCDGGRSAVRELNGIRFPGAPYEHDFFVADTEATGSMVPEELNAFLWRDGFTLFFPMRGKDRWRVIGILPQRLRGRQGVTFDDVIPSLRDEAGADLSFRQCDWFSVYRIYHRCTEKFRDRRCFLLGDAAHVHSPMGGQGMNTGLQDAYNLAWKLERVATGHADDALLDTFDTERMKVAKLLLSSTDRAFTLVVSDRWFGSIFRTRIMARAAAFAMKRERTRLLAFRTLSQIGISYRDSALSQTLPGLPEKAPRAGDRFPWLKLRLEPGEPVQDLFETLDDRTFSLLVIGQPVPAELTAGLGGLVRVYGVPDDAANVAALKEAGVPETSFWLLRPDGYVGLAGIRLDAEAIRRWFARFGISAGNRATDMHPELLRSA